MPRDDLIRVRRDTAADWSSVNPVLDEGEPGLELDSGQVKYGDGVTAWNDLPYSGGGEGGFTTWSTLTGKPATFPPSPHQHVAADVTDLAPVATSGSYADLDGAPAIPDSPDDVGAAPAVHGHAVTDVTGLQTALDGKADASAIPTTAAEVGADPAGSAAAAQTAAATYTDQQVATRETPAGAQAKADAAVAGHSADTTGVHGIPDTALLETTAGAQGKADAAVNAHEAAADPHPQYETSAEAAAKVSAHAGTTTGVHGIADTAALETQDGAQAKADAAEAAIRADRGQPGGFASLDPTGLVPSAQIPPIATTETFTVNTEAAMLALNAQRGDIAIRTDLGDAQRGAERFVLAYDDPAVLENWITLGTAGDHVLSVDGRTGVIDLSDRYDAAGTAAASRTAHEQATDPHPQYDTAAEAQARVDAHAGDTTDVHGIPDTSVLETQAGAQAKADAAETAAGTYTDQQVATREPSGTAAAAVEAHRADTTAVHGIPDTSALLDTADVGAPSGVAPLDADSRLPEAHVRPRLAATAPTITDWNAVTETGWAKAGTTTTTATNAPSVGTFIGITLVLSQDHMVQEVRRLQNGGVTAGTETFCYRRVKDLGTWGPWSRVRVTESEMDARYVRDADVGAASGVAPLGADSKVPAANLPDPTPGPTGPAGVQVVSHGTDANVARPAGVPVVMWVGTVKPNNGLAYDWWYNG